MLKVFEDLLGLSKIKNLDSKNTDLQRKVDHKLNMISDECPKDVINFFILMRDTARFNKDVLKQLPITSARSELERDLDNSIKIYSKVDSQLDNVYSTWTKCEKLRSINNDL